MGNLRPCKMRKKPGNFIRFIIHKYKGSVRCKVRCQWCNRSLLIINQGLEEVLKKHTNLTKLTNLTMTSIVETLGWITRTAADGWPIQTFETYCICPLCKPAKLAELEWGKT